jgi:hypothetical protein
LETVSVKKKGIIASRTLKMNRFVTRKRDSEKCENNIKQNLAGMEPSHLKFIKIDVFLS